jgi:hypothetical protein
MGNGMPQTDRNRKFARLALCATFGAFLVVAGGVAGAYAADDDDSMLPDEKFFRSLMRAIGLRNGQEAGIEAKERPPLVVPPSRDLPPPAAGSSLTANNPAWPSDPDEKKRAADRKAKANRKPYNPETDQNQLMPDQLATRSDKPAVKSGDGPDHSPELTPSQLGYTGGLWKTLTGTFSSGKEVETSTFRREPSRNSLTDPPVGYRTPSPAQPYGINTATERAQARSPTDRQVETINR